MLNLDVKKLCSYCQKSPLSFSAQPHCGALPCQMEWHKEKQHKTGDYWKALEVKHQKNIQGIVEQWGSDKNISVEEIALVEVPNCNASLEEVPDMRKEGFEEHLKGLLSDLDNVTQETLLRSPFDTHKNTNVSHLLGSMCALCNGKCCNKGRANNAFIQRSTLQRVIDNVDEISEENIVEIYMQHIPKESMGGSCLFHTDKGCCLSGELRANICDEFFCLNISDFIDSYHELPAPKSTMVISAHECEVRKVSVFESKGEELEVVEVVEVVEVR